MQELITPGLPVEIAGGLVQYETLFWSTAAVIVTALLGWWLGRKPRKYPGRKQVAAELLVAFWDRLCKDLLGPRRGRKYLALFGSLFLFVVACNMTGLVPLHGLTLGLFPRHGLEIGGEPYRDFNDNHRWDPGEPPVRFGRTDWKTVAVRTPDMKGGDPNAGDRRRGFVIPALEEPTKNVNVPIGLSLFLAVGMYAAAVIIRGVRGAWRQLFQPLAFMFPLNLMGQVAQAVSVSFRLFGNIFGGAVIVIVVGGLVRNVLVPIGLDLFMGVFIGLIQAFVFTMLWITYHAEWVAEES